MVIFIVRAALVTFVPSGHADHVERWQSFAVEAGTKFRVLTLEPDNYADTDAFPLKCGGLLVETGSWVGYQLAVAA